MIIVVFHVIKEFLYIKTRNHIPLPVQLRDHDVAHDFHTFFGMTIVMHVRIPLAFSPALSFWLSDIVQQCRQIDHIIFHSTRKVTDHMEGMHPQIILVCTVLLIIAEHGSYGRNQHCDFFSPRIHLFRSFCCFQHIQQLA